MSKADEDIQELLSVIFDPRPPIWVGTELIARRLGTTQAHIRKLCAAGKIPYAKLGRLYRFYTPDVDDWLRKL